MTAAIHDLLSWLEGRNPRSVRPTEGAWSATPEREKPYDDPHWLDRYLFDREWRADVDAVMAVPEREARR